MSIPEELQQHIVQQYLKGQEPAGFDGTFDLIGSGVLTSLVLVDLLAHIEQRYGVVFGEHDIVPEHFESIDALANYITAQQQTTSPLPITEQAPVPPPATMNERHPGEPIAVLGMGCRFPGGANTPEAFWALLRSGQDVLTDVPPERWNIDAYYDPNPESPGKMYVRQGYFLQEIDQFDPDFFGISPRDAVSLDPQQRLLLEVCWETLEHAGIAADQLRDSPTGVFIGGFWDDYAVQGLYQDAAEQLDAYRLLSHLRGMMAGRIAYILGLQGPTLQIDTACSSSLVAIHLACQSLRNGECTLALAGGVELNLSPERTIALCRMGALAPDGRSKAFAAAADGFGQGEGCGVVVLKRLSDARRDSDPILAVIRGSAINHDGRSTGLTVPNGRAQEVLLRQALQHAGVRAQELQFIETHGTGTPLGDPTEVRALAAVFGQHGNSSVWLGAVKANIGHLSAAAGVASFIKVVEALRRGEIPPQLHVDRPNPQIGWDDSPFAIPKEPTPWEDERRLAGISSFGMTGTNAHVILEAGEQVQRDAQAQATLPAVLLTLSAKTENALRAMTRQYAEHLAAQPGLALADVAYTAATRRSHFAHRLALVAPDTASAQQQLAAIATGDMGDTIFGTASRTTAKVAFLFTGQGSQYAGMGRQLYETQPIYQASLDECAALLQPHLDMPLLDVLVSDDERLQQTMYTQPALFALEYALARLWQAWGVQPALLLGHSIGEYVAACLAGVFSLADALKLVAARGRLMQALPQTGQMVAIQADPQAVQAAVEPYAAQASLAAVNSPRSVVIAGETEAVQAIASQFAAEGVKTRGLQTSHAFHSPLMEPMLNEFAAVAQEITYHPPRLPVVSDVSGQVAGDEFTTPAYWVQHARQPVQFAAGMTALAEAGATVYLEVGPHPTLMVMGQQCLSDEQAGSAAWAASLHREREDWPHLLGALGSLYVAGVPLDWEAVYPPAQHQRVPLPTYPFQRQRYWVEPQQRRTRKQVRPLLDTMLRLPLLHATAFETEISTEMLPWLADHQVFGSVVLPGAGSLALVLSAAEVLWNTPGVQVQDVVLPQPLVIPDGQARTAQLLLQPSPMQNGTPTAEAQLISLPADASAEGEPIPHLTGTVSTAPALAPVDLAALQARCSVLVDLTNAPEDESILLGPCFRWLAQVWRGEGEALARLAQPEAIDRTEGHLIHPALLDACLQLSGYTQEPASETLLPFAIEKITLTAPAHPGSVWWAHARQTGNLRWDITLLQQDGQVLAAVEGFQMRAATASALLAQQQTRQWLYALAWRAQPLTVPETVAAGRWLLVGDAAPVQADLLQQGQHATVVAADDQEALAAALAEGQAFAGVVYLATAPDSDPERIPAQAEAIYTGALHLAQTLVQSGQAPRLWLVTRGTQQVQNGEAVQVSGAVLWGLGRTLAHEHPELQPTLVDLPAAPADDEATRLVAELLAGSEETQLAYRDGQRLLARLVRYQSPALPAGPLAVELAEYGTLDNLRLAPLQCRAPGAGEVEIDIHAAALNFRDVLRALGLLQAYEDPTAPKTSIRLGFECAGVIVRVGAGVTDLAAGERVLAITPYGSLASAITISAANAVPLPEGLSFAAAATLPVAFATAYYGLHTLARLQPGERVLIHAAAGGVGQAAVQVARAAGAEIFATASPAKWDFLRQQGVAHIFNSRTLDFADQVLQATDGRGVDVVLNSLNGEFIPASFATLAAGGRFVEMGKVGIWGAEEARTHRPDVSYLPFDLAEELTWRGLSPRGLLSPIMQQVAAGQAQPLPATTFPVQRIQEAFRFMQQARHIGKVIITLQDEHTASIQPDASYLITGGLGGLGLTIARALVAQGARHLVLSGRSGAASEAAQQTLADLHVQGVAVQVVRADMARQDDVQRLLAAAQEHAPLRGIIHAAGVLDDSTLLQQTPERYQRVAAPKVAGSWHLHTLSRTLPLDFLVLFSSVAALLGHAGQANYAAANAFLDSLAHARQAQGMPALSINWGAWARVGLAQQRASAGQMQMTDATSMTPEQGAQVFHMLLTERGQIGVIPGLAQMSGSTPFLQEVLHPRATPAPASALRQRLAQAGPDERQRMLAQHVQQQIGSVLGRKEAAPLDEGFFDLGMDSLMAVELRNALQKSLECKLPGTLTFDYPTGAALVAYLQTLLFGNEAPAADPPPLAAATAPHMLPTDLDKLDHLSEAELADLVDKTLADLNL